MLHCCKIIQCCIMIHMPKWQMPIWQCCIMIHVKIGGLGKLGNLGKIGKIGKMRSQRKLGVSEDLESAKTWSQRTWSQRSAVSGKLCSQRSARIVSAQRAAWGELGKSASQRKYRCFSLSNHAARVYHFASRIIIQ